MPSHSRPSASLFSNLPRELCSHSSISEGSQEHGHCFQIQTPRTETSVPSIHSVQLKLGQYELDDARTRMTAQLLAHRQNLLS